MTPPTQENQNSPELQKEEDKYRDTKPYCCRYFHDGGWWGLELHAFDAADAEARAAKLGNLQVLGELKATIPANLPASGLFVRLLCWFKNL